MKKDSFVFYRSFFEALQDMGKEEQADCLMTLCDYALNGEDATRKPPTPVAGMFLKLAKPQIDANNRRFENGCKGAEYGKLGGRPKKPQENPKQTPNDNDNENDNDFNKKTGENKKNGNFRFNKGIGIAKFCGEGFCFTGKSLHMLVSVICVLLQACVSMNFFNKLCNFVLHHEGYSHNLAIAK